MDTYTNKQRIMINLIVIEELAIASKELDLTHSEKRGLSELMISKIKETKLRIETLPTVGAIINDIEDLPF